MPPKSTKPSRCHQGISDFDQLPDAANVAIAVVCALFDCSPATVWRRVRNGELVAPLKFGKRTTRWNVGALREALKGHSDD